MPHNAAFAASPREPSVAACLGCLLLGGRSILPEMCASPAHCSRGYISALGEGIFECIFQYPHRGFADTRQCGTHGRTYKSDPPTQTFCGWQARQDIPMGGYRRHSTVVSMIKRLFFGLMAHRV